MDYSCVTFSVTGFEMHLPNAVVTVIFWSAFTPNASEGTCDMRRKRRSREQQSSLTLRLYLTLSSSISTFSVAPPRVRTG